MSASRPLFFPFFPALAALVCLLLCSGCAPRQNGATSQSLYAGGLANFSIAVSPPLTLASSGWLTAWTPSDVNLKPSATFNYALFGEGESGPVTRHAHCIFSELPKWNWRWEKETWALPQSLSYAQEREGGKNWTVQILPVTAQGDWFSDLWMEKGREIPEFWLAKRWSATPEDEMRLVAEYREPAPFCMRDRLEKAASAHRDALPLKGKELWRGCEKDVEEFSARADTVFAMQRLRDIAPVSGQPLEKRSGKMPDMGKLVGRSEKIDQGGYDYNP